VSIQRIRLVQILLFSVLLRNMLAA
jgi:hypothetical protein